MYLISLFFSYVLLICKFCYVWSLANKYTFYLPPLIITLQLNLSIKYNEVVNENYVQLPNSLTFSFQKLQANLQYTFAQQLLKFYKENIFYNWVFCVRMTLLAFLLFISLPWGNYILVLLQKLQFLQKYGIRLK